MRKSNILTGILFFALAVFAYVQTFSMEARLNMDVLGPAFWPKCLSVALGIFSILLIAVEVVGKRSTGKPSPFHIQSAGFRRVLKLSVLMVVFGAIVYFFGIFPGIIIMMPICMALHGERNRLLLAGLTVGMAAFIFLVFGLALNVPLPSGVIFS